MVCLKGWISKEYVKIPSMCYWNPVFSKKATVMEDWLGSSRLLRTQEQSSFSNQKCIQWSTDKNFILSSTLFEYKLDFTGHTISSFESPTTLLLTKNTYSKTCFLDIRCNISLPFIVFYVQYMGIKNYNIKTPSNLVDHNCLSPLQYLCSLPSQGSLTPIWKNFHYENAQISVTKTMEKYSLDSSYWWNNLLRSCENRQKQRQLSCSLY